MNSYYTLANMCNDLSFFMNIPGKEIRHRARILREAGLLPYGPKRQSFRFAGK